MKSVKFGDVYVIVNFNCGGRKAMVEPVEARGHRSICSLLDLQDWSAAVRRLKELGIEIRHHGNRPVVSVEQVREASRKWFGQKKSEKHPHKHEKNREKP